VASGAEATAANSNAARDSAARQNGGGARAVRNGMKEIRVETVILASGEQVWQVLTWFPAYCMWNPAIRRARGQARPGERLDLRVVLFGFLEWELTALVVAAEAPRHLAWKAHLGAPFLFAAEHSFDIQSAAQEGVVLIQRETYSGLLAPFLAPLLAPFTRRTFEQMNQALAGMAEGAASAAL